MCNLGLRQITNSLGLVNLRHNAKTEFNNDLLSFTVVHTSVYHQHHNTLDHWMTKLSEPNKKGSGNELSSHILWIYFNGSSENHIKKLVFWYDYILTVQRIFQPWRPARVFSRVSDVPRFTFKLKMDFK